MVEPDGKNQDFVLRKMMDTNDRGVAVAQKTPPRLERKDNLFRSVGVSVGVWAVGRCWGRYQLTKKSKQD